MLADVFLFLGIYLVLLAVTFFPGFFFLRLLKNSIVIEGLYTKAFFSFLCGLVFIVTTFAIIKTCFLTITLFFPLVFLLAFRKKKINLKPFKNQGEQRKITPYIISGILILLPFIYFSLIVFKSGDFHFKALEYDNAVYGQLSDYLADSGLENKWFSYFTDTSTIKGIEPYHYIECWITALVIFVFKTNALVSFYLVTYPLLITISLFGILAVMEYYKKIKIPDLILSCLLLFTGAVFGIKNANYHFNTMACEIPLQHYGEKFGVYYPFVLLLVLLVLYGFGEEALICSLSLCIVSSTLFPAFFLSFVLFTLFRFRKTTTSSKIKLFLVLMTMLVFYKVFSKQDISAGNTPYLFGFSDFSTFDFSSQWFKLSSSNFAYAFARSFFYFLASYFYVPFLVLLILRDQKLLRLSSFAGVICFSGLLCACFFYRFSENYQFFTNTLPLLHVLCITLLISLLYTSNKIPKLCTQIFIIVFAFYNLYYSMIEYNNLNMSSSVSDAYLLKAKGLIDKEGSHPKIGFICTQNDADFLQNNRTKNYLSHLPYLGIDPVPLRMSVLEVKNRSNLKSVQEDYKMLYEHELFYTFYLRHKDLIKNKDSLQLNFLNFYKIRYLLLSPNAGIPAFIIPLNSNSVRDPKTGIRFIYLAPF